MKAKPVVCFGEVLWDVLPGGERLPGGAPLNVAYHLRKLGLDPVVVSAVGRDQDGDDLLKWMRKAGLSVKAVSRAGHPTGRAEVHLEKGGGAHFHIATPAAWDAIEADQRLVQTAYDAGAIVFGSLAARGPGNQRVLDLLLSMSGALRVMDVNLRPPHSSPKVVLAYATQSDLLKCNEEELSLMSGVALTARSGDAAVAKAAAALSEKLQVLRIAVTRGAKGALLWDAGEVHTAPAPKVKVADTVGAGDAFTAGLVAGLLRGDAPAAALAHACALGAVVASLPGAQPEYTPPAPPKKPAARKAAAKTKAKAKPAGKPAAKARPRRG